MSEILLWTSRENVLLKIVVNFVVAPAIRGGGLCPTSAGPMPEKTGSAGSGRASAVKTCAKLHVHVVLCDDPQKRGAAESDSPSSNSDSELSVPRGQNSLSPTGSSTGRERLYTEFGINLSRCIPCILSSPDKSSLSGSAGYFLCTCKSGYFSVSPLSSSLHLSVSLVIFSPSLVSPHLFFFLPSVFSSLSSLLKGHLSKH